MRVAVVQHGLRDTPAEDAAGMLEAARAASADRAGLLVLPGWPHADDAGGAGAVVSTLRGEGVACVMPGSDSQGVALEVVPGCEELGLVASLVGDACFDSREWSRLLAESPSAVILSPLSENDLQAEAALEVALALSDALCGLVIIAECAGAELGEPGHGGSAIVLLGDDAAEAFGEQDLLEVEVRIPVPQPEPREPLPEVPTILAQRLARHSGRKPEVGYLADLSDGRRER